MIMRALLLPLCVLCCLVTASCFEDCTLTHDLMSLVGKLAYSPADCRLIQDYVQCLDGCAGDEDAKEESKTWTFVSQSVCNGNTPMGGASGGFGLQDGTSYDVSDECGLHCLNENYAGFATATYGYNAENCKLSQDFSNCLRTATPCLDDPEAKAASEHMDQDIKEHCGAFGVNSGASWIHSATGVLGIALAFVVTLRLHV